VCSNETVRELQLGNSGSCDVNVSVGLHVLRTRVQFRLMAVTFTHTLRAPRCALRVCVAVAALSWQKRFLCFSSAAHQHAARVNGP